MNDGQLIEKLGGEPVVASILGITTPSVHGWKGKIPEHRKIFLAVVAEQKGITTRKALFPENYQTIWPELQ